MEYTKAEVTKEFSFDAAHRLKDVTGKCESLHGHTWKVQITIEGKINENGIVYDFTKMKKVLNEKIKSKLDHRFVNDIIEQPTAENIALWIYNEVKNILPNISKIRVYESPESFATIYFKG